MSAALASLFVLAIPCAVRADFGPKLIQRVRVEVWFEGSRLSNGATAALLEPAEQSGGGRANAAASVPTLMLPYVDESGKRWNYAGYLWGGRLRDGTVTFTGFMDYELGKAPPGGLPSIVRLAVYDPETDRLYITGTAKPGQHLALMRAELSADGNGVLQSILIPFWQRVDFWKALLITLFVECFIVLSIVRRRSQSEDASIAEPSRRRLATVCILINLVTLPLVWLFAGEALFSYGFWLGLAAVLGLELGAVAVEAIAYRGLRRTARVPWTLAVRVSALANLCTFLLGFIL